MRSYQKPLEWIIELGQIFKSFCRFWRELFSKRHFEFSLSLCKYYGLEEVADYWHQVIKINDYQKDRFAQKIIDHFGGDLTGKKIAVLGWAFKANTNDSRESPAIYVAEKLFKAGAILEIYDPMVSKESILAILIFIGRLQTKKI